MENKTHIHEYVMGPRKKMAVCRCGAIQHGPANTNPAITEIRATQTPWKIENSPMCPGPYVLDKFGRPVARDVEVEDAELIVRAVNSHEWLVGTLEALKAELKNRLDDGIGSDPIDLKHYVAMINTALNKSKQGD